MSARIRHKKTMESHCSCRSRVLRVILDPQLLSCQQLSAWDFLPAFR